MACGVFWPHGGVGFLFRFHGAYPRLSFSPSKQSASRWTGLVQVKSEVLKNKADRMRGACGCAGFVAVLAASIEAAAPAVTAGLPCEYWLCEESATGPYSKLNVSYLL